MFKSKSMASMLLGCVVNLGIGGVAFAHEGHVHDQTQNHIAEEKEICDAKAQTGGVLTTGQGDFVFSWDKELTAAFPNDAKPHEGKMHGGFNEDPETNIVYTGIPGYGLCSISADLKTWKKLGNDPILNHNVHGIVFFKHKGEKRIALAQNGAQRIVITDINGKVVQVLGKPDGKSFEFEAAKNFYNRKRPHFAVTDVTYLDGKIYAVTGYSRGDFVLTAEEKDGKWAWGKVAWGGKGRQPGTFQTAHGVYAHEGHIYVANREAHQVVKFTKDGKLVEVLKDIPKGSRVCNVAFLKEHFIFCPLAKVEKNQKTAPIYAHTGEKLVSKIVPGDLNIPVLRHVHHAWPHYVTQADGSKQMYILIHGWNRGKYAVLKHEPTANKNAAK